MVQIDIRGVIVPDGDIWIYDWLEIPATAPKSVRDALSKAGTDEVVVTINSNGGDVWAGQEMYTMLRDHPGKVTIKIQSIAFSAASVVAMARESEISPVAQLMIHNVSSRAAGDHRDMEHAAEVLRSSNQALASAYIQKTGKPEAEILDMMDHETWLTAQEAVEQGFVDRIMFSEAAKPAAPMQLAANFGPGLLSAEVIQRVKQQINRNPADASAKAHYEFLLLEGKTK